MPNDPPGRSDESTASDAATPESDTTEDARPADPADAADPVDGEDAADQPDSANAAEDAAASPDVEPLPDFRKHWNFRDPASSEVKFREILALAEARGDDDYRAELLTQIARTHGLRRDFAKSHEILDTVEPLLRDAAALPRVRYLLERGRTFNSSGEKEPAALLFEEAFGVAQEAQLDGLAIDAAHMLGIVLPRDDSLAWNERAIQIAEETTDERAKGWLGPLYNNTGWTYHTAGEYERALELFERCHAYHVAKENAEQTRIARWTVGRCLRSLGRVEEAYAIQVEVLAAREASGTPAGYVHEELGECLLLLDRADEAPAHFAKAWEVLETNDWMKTDEPERYERLRKLAGGE